MVGIEATRDYHAGFVQHAAETSRLALLWVIALLWEIDL